MRGAPTVPSPAQSLPGRMALLSALAVVPCLLATWIEVRDATGGVGVMTRGAVAVACTATVGLTWWVARRGCGRIEERVRERTERIREQNRALVELAKQDSVAGGADPADPQDALRRLTEVASRTMRVARASVWVID